MNNYKEKYKKYKSKYLNLLKKNKQTGGGVEIIFDLNNYKDLYRKFIFELNHEIAFSLDYDPDTGNLISEFIKGIPIVIEEGISNEIKLFNDSICFTHINCHTHDNFSAHLEGFRFAPPSPDDFKLLIENFCKYNTYLELVFTPEGIYEISLGDELIDKLNNEPLSLMRWVYAPTSRRYNVTKSYPEWEKFMETFLYRINDIHLLAIKPKRVPIRIYEETQADYMLLYGVPAIDTIKVYLEEIRKVGFNIKLYTWDEPLNIKLIIPTNINKFFNAAIKAKKGGYLLDILLINSDVFQENNDNEEDNEHLMKTLNENRYVDLDINSIDEIFDIAVNDF